MFFGSRTLRLNGFLLLLLTIVWGPAEGLVEHCLLFFPLGVFFLSFHFPKGFHLLQSRDSHTVHCGRHSGLSKTIIFVAVGLWLQRIELGDLWQQAQTVRWDGRRPSVRGDPRRLCWISGSGAVVGLCGATGASGLVSAALPNHLLCDLQ